MKYGAIFKSLRTEKKLSQQELADYMQINRSTYARYETSQTQPDFDTLFKLATFYDVSIDYLLGYSDEKNTYANITPTQKTILDFFENSPSLSFDEGEAETLQKVLQDVETYYEFLKFKAQKNP
ncbi:helix-turn-helix domain-containing protein [Kurthia huakuii]|uniref:helix-turn-helix domain-containing protein n=1 Tax=Kurthia huakuii TaxID=1421019 RepID=UPI0004960002|nr:helix-turn-helix transcriptional regulator [Kurthia huakuii]MBM7699826.1 transcriptional regulator with XRE-family HTH domain [Kurthia huakuii]